MADIVKEQIKEVVEACHEGIREAHEGYKRISGGEWLYWAPEYYITSAIFDQLGELDEVLVDLEADVSNAMSTAGAKGPGRHKKALRANGRCDLLVWHPDPNDEDADYLPTIPIEVKCDPFDSSGYLKDIERLCEMVSKKAELSSINAGVFAFYLCDENLERLTNKRFGVVNRIEDKIDKSSFSVSIQHKTSVIECDDEDEAGAWSSTTVLIQKIKDENK